MLEQVVRNIDLHLRLLILVVQPALLLRSDLLRQELGEAFLSLYGQRLLAHLLEGCLLDYTRFILTLTTTLLLLLFSSIIFESLVYRGGTVLGVQPTAVFHPRLCCA